MLFLVKGRAKLDTTSDDGDGGPSDDDGVISMVMVVECSDRDDDINDGPDGHKSDDDFRDSVKNWFKNKQIDIVKLSLPLSKKGRNPLL